MKIYHDYAELTNVEPVEFIESGWPYLNKHYKPYKTMMCMVTGTPGSGKTLFLLQHALHMAKQGYRTAFCLFENDSMDVHYFVEQYCHAEKLDPAEIYTKYLKLVEIDDDTRPSIEWCKSVIIQLQMDHDWTPDFFMIDPWNQVEGVQAKVSLEQQQKNNLADIKAFFRVRRIGLIIACHPTKAVINENGSTRMVRAGDISGSMHFWNASDYVITLNRLKDQKTLAWLDQTVLVVDKVKKQGRRTGLNTGTASLEWSERCQQLFCGEYKDG